MWDLIVSVPDHCLSFYLVLHTSILKFYAYKQVEKHAVILCQTEKLYMHMSKIDFRTRSMKYLPEILFIFCQHFIC